MSCSCQYDARAVKEGSRAAIDLEKLKEAAWTVEKIGKRYILDSPLPEKKRFQSTKEVADFLKSRNTFHHFARNCDTNVGVATQQESSDSDEDYRPNTEEEAGMSSAFDDNDKSGRFLSATA